MQRMLSLPRTATVAVVSLFLPGRANMLNSSGATFRGGESAQCGPAVVSRKYSRVALFVCLCQCCGGPDDIKDPSSYDTGTFESSDGTAPDGWHDNAPAESAGTRSEARPSGAGVASNAICNGRSQCAMPPVISAGDNFTCAITTQGGVKCWGYNFVGRLGNGTERDSLVPTQVSGLSSGVVAVSCADFFACALTSAGAVLCWGDNLYGGLGGATHERYSAVPILVPGLSSGVVSVLARGRGDGYAFTSAGAAMRWAEIDSHSDNADNARRTNRPKQVSGLVSGVLPLPPEFGSSESPVSVDCVLSPKGRQCRVSNDADSRIVAVSTSTSSNSGCALTTAGTVVCWGSNGVGQVGDGTNIKRSVPTQVVGLPSGVTAVSRGLNHACAIATSGQVLCWGQNDYGQLGNGTTTNSSVPTPVTGFP